MSNIEINTSYKQPLDWMQATRRENLSTNLLRLDLTDQHLQALASVSIAGCVEALQENDTDKALAFARYWRLYHFDQPSAGSDAGILTEPMNPGL